MGKGKKVLGIVGAAFGFGSPAIFGLSSTAHLLGAIYGASLGTTIWSATHQPKQTTSHQAFDSIQDTIDSSARIPVIYGTRKWGGVQSYHYTSSDGKTLTKDNIVCEGEIQGIYGVTANDLLIKSSSDNLNCIGTTPTGKAVTGKTSQLINAIGYIGSNTHVFSMINVKYSDATVAVIDSNKNPTGNDKRLRLYANGKTTDILLQHPDDLNTGTDNNNDFSCYLSKLYQYIMGINYSTTFASEGWMLINPVITSDAPETVNTFGATPCYNTPVSISINANKLASSTSAYDLHVGSYTDEPPENYMSVGSYSRMAWMRSKIVQTDALQGGNPNVVGIVQGMKVLDTRTNTTIYSENPAMCIRDYLLSKRYGAGYFISMDMLDEDSFKEVADYCDQPVTYKDHNGNTITEPRYTLNIILDEKKKHSEHIADMLSCFGGFLVFTNDHISLRVERAQSPVYDFTDDTIIQDSIEYKEDSLSNTPNKYIMTYYEPIMNWTGVKALVEDLVSQQPYPIGRGKIIEKDISLPGVTRQSQALRLGKLYLDLTRLCPIKITFQTTTMAMHLEPGDVVTITKYIYPNGVKTVLFNKMPVRILEIQQEKDTWSLTVQQYNESIYNDALGAQIQVKNYVKVSNPYSTAPAQVTNVNVNEYYRDLGNGVVTNNLELTFDHNIMFYDHAEVYCLSDNPSIAEIGESWDNLEGTIDSITTSSNAWTYLGNAVDRQTFTNAIKGLKYTFKIISVNSAGLKSEPVYIEHTVKGKTLTPLVPTGLNLSITDTLMATWDKPRQEDVDFFELRLDMNVGQQTGLLTKTTSVKADITGLLSSRTGKIFLYAHNIAGYYSDPAYYEYNKPKPAAPTNVKAADIFQGTIISCDTLPQNCKGINVHIESTVYFSPNNSYTFSTTGGIFDIQVGYVDVFGEGELSDVIEKTVVPTIDPALIKAESISLEKMDTTIKAAVAAAQNAVSGTTFDATVNQLNQVDSSLSNSITQTAGQTTSIITELSKSNPSYTSFTQLNSAINLRASKANLISQINVCPEAITIDGKYTHITGDTVIDGNVITGGMIKSSSISTGHLVSSSVTTEKLAAGSVTAGKISTNSLSAICATIGTLRTATSGARTEIKDNLIEVYDANNILRVRMGVW